MNKLNIVSGKGSADSYNITSCFQTMTVVAKTLAGQKIPKNSLTASVIEKMVPIPSWSTTAVSAALDSEQVVIFHLSFSRGNSNAGAGDHYFTAFKLDDARVVVSMGWQDIYDFTQWFRENDGGRFKRMVFDGLVEKIGRKDLKGIGDLCAFLGVTSQGLSILSKMDTELRFLKFNAQVFTVPLAT